AVRPRLSLGAKLFFENALVTFVEANSDRSLSLKVELNLRFVVEVLRPSLPIKICARNVINPPRNQLGLRFRFRTILNEEIMIVGVGAAIESNVSAIVARAPDGGIVVAKMPPALVKVGGVDE